MPKIVVNPKKKGIQQSRGNGFHHLDENEKGIKYVVDSGAVTLSGTDDALTGCGIFIPANAVVTKLAIKKTVIGVDDADSDLEFEVDEIKIGSAAWGLTDKIVGDAGSVGDVQVYDLSEPENATHDGASLENLKLDATGGEILFVENESGTITVADTAAQFDVVVEYYVVQF